MKKYAERLILFFIFFTGALIYKNPGQVTVWFFGPNRMGAAEIVAILFGSGIITGLLISSFFRRKPVPPPVEADPDDDDENYTPKDQLSAEDRNYIS